ncbi:MAG: hypothetical protein ACI9R3_005070, partial [Verrucomicrobiales bacterium]
QREVRALVAKFHLPRRALGRRAGPAGQDLLDEVIRVFHTVALGMAQIDYTLIELVHSYTILGMRQHQKKIRKLENSVSYFASSYA